MKLLNIIAEYHEEVELDSLLEEVTDQDRELVKESETKLLNEASITSIVIGAVLAAPKLLEYLSKIVAFVAKIFRKFVKGDQDATGENKVTDWLHSKGHTLHSKYLKLVIKAVKLFGVASSVWKNEDGSVDEAKLKLTAEVLLNVAIAIAGSAAIYGAVGAAVKGKAVFAAIEGSLGAIKADELATAVKELGPKIASAVKA